MEQDDPFRPDEPPSGAESSALQIISLVLGGMSIPGALFFGLGILPGLLGLVFGIVAGRRAKWGSGMASIGIALSLMGVLMSIGMVVFMVWAFNQTTKMTAQLAEDQVAANRAWEGVLAPDLNLTLTDRTAYSLQDRANKKLVLFQFFPFRVAGPFLRGDAEVWVETVNRLADSAGEDFDVVAVVAMPQEAAESIASEFGLTAPVVGSQTLPEPFISAGFGSYYYIVDRNGVFQHTFDANATYEELLEAATGPDFEGEAATEPDLSGIETKYTFVPIGPGARPIPPPVKPVGTL